jgi:hypothetical protein
MTTPLAPHPIGRVFKDATLLVIESDLHGDGDGGLVVH